MESFIGHFFDGLSFWLAQADPTPAQPAGDWIDKINGFLALGVTLLTILSGLGFGWAVRLRTALGAVIRGVEQSGTYSETRRIKSTVKREAEAAGVQPTLDREVQRATKSLERRPL